MREIQLKDAKATLSAVVDQAVRGNPAVITRHGRKEAVVLSFDEYEKLSNVPSLGRLLASFPGEEEDIPVRSGKPFRMSISDVPGRYQRAVRACALKTGRAGATDRMARSGGSEPVPVGHICSGSHAGIAKAEREGATTKARA